MKPKLPTKVPKLPVVTARAETLQAWLVRKEHVMSWRNGLQEESMYGVPDSLEARERLYSQLALGIGRLFSGIPPHQAVEERVGAEVAEEFSARFREINGQS
jgi:hypothetical protein